MQEKSKNRKLYNIIEEAITMTKEEIKGIENKSTVSSL